MLGGQIPYCDRPGLEWGASGSLTLFRVGDRNILPAHLYGDRLKVGYADRGVWPNPPLYGDTESLSSGIEAGDCDTVTTLSPFRTFIERKTLLSRENSVKTSNVPRRHV